MLDALHPDGDAERPPRPAEGAHPLADREVPIEVAGTSLPASLHAWLDGEGSEADARLDAGARDVEFWKRVTDELVQRRTRRTPASLAASIMAAIR